MAARKSMRTAHHSGSKKSPFPAKGRPEIISPEEAASCPILYYHDLVRPKGTAVNIVHGLGHPSMPLSTYVHIRAREMEDTSSCVRQRERSSLLEGINELIGVLARANYKVPSKDTLAEIQSLRDKHLAITIGGDTPEVWKEISRAEQMVSRRLDELRKE